MVERLHSEQYIINKVFDPSNNTLRVESETAIVVSGLNVSLGSTVNQGLRGPEPWMISGLVTLSNPGGTASVVQANQGTRGPDPWPVILSSGTVAVTVGDIVATQGKRGPEPWAVSGTVVVSNTITTNATITNTPTVNQGSTPWIVSGLVTLSNPSSASTVQANQGNRGPEPWPVSGTVVISNTVTSNATIINQPTIIQGNSSGAPWIVSGLVTLSNPTTVPSVIQANQGTRGPEPWVVSGTVVISNTVPVTISSAVLVNQGTTPWIVSGLVTQVVQGVTSATNGSVDIYPVSTTVIALNSSRKYAEFTNDASQIIYLSESSSASLHKGVRLNSDGGSYEINSTNLYKGVVSAICMSGIGTLTFIEG